MKSFGEKLKRGRKRKNIKKKKGEGTKLGIRVVSNKIIPATKEKCNSTLTTRDGYCERPPALGGERCVMHSRNNAINNEAKLIYKQALTPEQAIQLEALIADSQSMEGEIALQKTELVADMKRKILIQNRLEELRNDTPIPDPVQKDEDGVPDEADMERFKMESECYEMAARERRRELNSLGIQYEKLNTRIARFLIEISRSVERNNKVVHGTKYTVTLQQLTQVMNFQIGVLEQNCVGCPKLATIAREFQEMRVRGLGSMEQMEGLVSQLPSHVKKAYVKQAKAFQEQNMRKNSEKAVEAAFEEVQE